ncbi:MAG: hypothetical protein R8G66_01175 [Cytophagales bacterium]|nr:hypothetical protein [Cytophagales bacterium]
MNFFSYVIEHDYGLAPNPFGGYCTLAVCKPGIRGNKNLEIGDWVIGTGSKKIKRINHLIYAMKVSEKMTFDEYWSDERFQYKRPIQNGSLVQVYGDNFYHTDEQTGHWIQETSAHSKVNGTKHTKTDTSSNTVLISNYFYYLGDNSILIPEEYAEIIKSGPGMKYKGMNDLGINLISWLLNSSLQKGINGDPINWTEHRYEIDQAILIK